MAHSCSFVVVATCASMYFSSSAVSTSALFTGYNSAALFFCISLKAARIFAEGPTKPRPRKYRSELHGLDIAGL